MSKTTKYRGLFIVDPSNDDGYRNLTWLTTRPRWSEVNEGYFDIVNEKLQVKHNIVENATKGAEAKEWTLDFPFTALSDEFTVESNTLTLTPNYLEEVSLNNVHSNGNYFCTNCTNTPMEDVNGTLYNATDGHTNTSQIFVVLASDELDNIGTMWYRYERAAAWSAWKKLH